jgi:predicted transcriptional regulator
MKIKKKSILLNLSEGRYNKLSDIASKKEKSVTAIIEDAIDNFIELYETNNKTQKLITNTFDTDFDVNKETNIW